MHNQALGKAFPYEVRTAMGFYAEWILPPLIDLSMRNKQLRPYRERTAGTAEGGVLDIGIGPGLNLPFYARNTREIFGLDPSLPLLTRARNNAPRTQIPVHLLEGSADVSRWPTTALIPSS